MIRILLLDEQKLVREGLKLLLESESDIEVVGSVSDGHAALDLIEYIDLDIVIIGKEIAESDEFSIIKKIQQKYPDLKVIILSNQVDESNFVQSLELGVEGYILDDIAVDDFKDVINYVNKGFTHVENTVLETIVLPKLSESCSTTVVKNLEQQKFLAAQELTGIFENKFLFKRFIKKHNFQDLVINHELVQENFVIASESEKTNNNSWKKKTLFSLGLGILGLSTISIGWFSLKYRRDAEVVINDAIINGELIAIKSPAEGILKEVIDIQKKNIEANHVIAEIELLKDNETEKIISQLEKDINLKQQQIDNTSNFVSFLETSLESLVQEYEATVIVATGDTNNILATSLDDNLGSRKKIDNYREILNLEQQIINQKLTTALLEKELNNLQEKLITTKAKINAEKATNIKAPISGKIHNLNYNSGDFINPNDEIATIINCQNLWIEAVVDPKVTAKINLQKDVSVKLADRESLIPGTITLIESLSDQQSRQYRDLQKQALRDRKQITNYESASFPSTVPINGINKSWSRIIVSMDFLTSELMKEDFCNIGLSAKIFIDNE